MGGSTKATRDRLRTAAIAALRPAVVPPITTKLYSKVTILMVILLGL